MDKIVNDLLFNDDETGTVGGVPLIRREAQCHFKKNLLPEKIDVRLPSSWPPLIQPRPDHCIGYVTYQKLQAGVDKRLSPFASDEELFIFPDAPTMDLHFCFLTAEGKSEIKGGSISKAVMQSARAGALMVKYLDSCYTKVGGGHSIVDTSHLSVTHNGSEARIYIHWRAEVEGKTRYLMRKVLSALLDDQEHVEAFRKVLRNHLEWALNVRLPKIQKMVKEMINGPGESATTSPASYQSHRTPISTNRNSIEFIDGPSPGSPTPPPRRLLRGPGRQAGLDLDTLG